MPFTTGKPFIPTGKRNNWFYEVVLSKEEWKFKLGISQAHLKSVFDKTPKIYMKFYSTLFLFTTHFEVTEDVRKLIEMINMGILVENSSFSLRFSLTALRLTGFWPSENLRGEKLLLYNCYGFLSFMILLGIFIITEIIDLYLVWGNLPLMTGNLLLLFTNLAQATKIINIVLRRKAILKLIADCDKALKADQSIEGRAIVESCNLETRNQQLFFCVLTIFTCAGWAGSAEKNKLPLKAWYPYDTSNHPAYEITYAQQVSAIIFAALLNVSKDTLVTTLIAQCRCSLQLVCLSLRNIHCEQQFIARSTPDGVSLTRPSPTFLTRAQETEVQKHLKKIVMQHQHILETALLLQNTFSEPIFAQFNVSLVIICTTAFQLVSQTGNLVRLVSMGTYLLNMIYQVFIYCYQGNQFSSESEEVAGAAYDMPWYSCSVRVRRSILIVMVRCRRVAKLTAGGFTTLSLNSFMAIIKTSYSLFTLLQQVTK